MLPTTKKRIEGFGLVFIEAGLAGLTVVGSDYGGIPDAIQSGETGVIVDPNNFDATAATILELVKNDELRQKLGRKGRERALKEFSPQRFTQQILHVLGL